MSWFKSKRSTRMPAYVPVARLANAGVFQYGTRWARNSNTRPSEAIQYTTRGMGNIDAYKLSNKINNSLI